MLCFFIRLQMACNPFKKQHEVIFQRGFSEMGFKALSFVYGFLMVVAISVASSMNAYSIENQAQWDAAFKSQYPTRDPLLGDPGQYPGDLFAWRGHYWLRAYVSMAETYGDTKYCDKAVALIDHMFYYRDDARQARGERDLAKDPYLSAPRYYLNNRCAAAPGWLRYWGGDRIEVVTDGTITQAIMRFVDLVFSDRRFLAYRTKAKTYIPMVEETVRAHDSSFVFNRFPNMTGSYYYPEIDGSGLYTAAIEFNQNATMGVTLLLLDKVKQGVPEYRQKAKAILQCFKNHVRTTSNGAYDWAYNFQKPTAGDTKTGSEDFNHAHLDLSFLILAYNSGLDLSAQDMLRLAKTLIRNVYLGNGELAWSIDGKETRSEKNYWPIGFDWIDLAQFDRSVLDIAREVYNKHYHTPTWARPYLGWAEILRWTHKHSNRLKN
jgi:hypothetical protein